MDDFVAVFPERWQELIEFLLLPIAWIPSLQYVLMDFFLESSSPWMAVAKYLLLLFPALLGLAALWSTQLALYSLPFRSRRVRFVSTMLLTWWDAARAVWLYWAGLVRCGAVVVGWVISLAQLVVRLVFEAVRQVAVTPFTIGGRMTQSYFQPGVPWVAFVMLVCWCVLEATIFTYTLLPTVTEVLSDLAGAQEAARHTTPILYFFLLLLIMGSFACVQTLADAVRKREIRYIVQIVTIELFVMFFEVMFLYRELVDALTPWIAQQTGARMGLWFTLSLATFGWLGVRGMTWFLFGQFGTAPLLAFISRRPLTPSEPKEATIVASTAPGWWQAPVADLKREIEWLHGKSDQLVEYLALPVLHLLAAAVNFGMVMVTSRQVFSVPFKGLGEITETRDILAAIHLQPKKQVSL